MHQEAALHLDFYWISSRQTNRYSFFFFVVVVFSSDLQVKRQSCHSVN